MDESNRFPLVDVSPPIYNVIRNLRHTPNNMSPGNNPFDNIFKEAKAQVDDHQNTPNDSLQLLDESFLQKEFDNMPNSSNVSLPEINDKSIDCGKESLGILKFSIDDALGFNTKLESIEEDENDAIRILQSMDKLDLEGSCKNVANHKTQLITDLKLHVKDSFAEDIMDLNKLLITNTDSNCEENFINDYVLQEAHKVAYNISQCVLSDSDLDLEEAGGFLDATPQPALYSDLSDIESEPLIKKPHDAEAVLKKLDQIIPTTKYCDVDNTQSSFHEHLSVNEHDTDSNSLENIVKEKVLSQLFTFANKSSTNDEHKSAALKWINNFGNFLHIDLENKEQKTDSLESNIAITSSASELELPLDLSIKNRTPSTPLRRSQSLELPKSKTKPAIGIRFPKNTQKTFQVEHSVLTRQSGLESSRLKPKVMIENKGVTNRGPLKAVIPIGNMAKISHEYISAAISATNLKKINSKNMKGSRMHQHPIAQSTPEKKSSIPTRNQFQNDSKRKSEIPMSPLVKTRSLNDISASNSNNCLSSQSGSSASAYNLQKSEHAIKRSSDPCANEISTISKKRSNSFGNISHIERVRGLAKQTRKSLNTSTNLKSSASSSYQLQSRKTNTRKSLENVTENTTITRNANDVKTTKEICTKNLRAVYANVEGKSVLNDINNRMNKKMIVLNTGTKKPKSDILEEKENAGHNV